MNKSFNQNCYELVRQVPKGFVTTYRDIAHKLNCRAYRAVGNAMNKNPEIYGRTPCHRVVNSDGRVGGFADDIRVKIDLLSSEGIEIDDNKIKNFKNVLFNFNNEK